MRDMKPIVSIAEPGMNEELILVDVTVEDAMTLAEILPKYGVDVVLQFNGE